MTTNWSVIFQQNFQPPETVNEAVHRLLMILDGEQKVVLAISQKENLIDLHFNLGLAIRNAFGLHSTESKLLTSCGVVHPDDASGVIIQALWRRLRSSSEA